MKKLILLMMLFTSFIANAQSPFVRGFKLPLATEDTNPIGKRIPLMDENGLVNSYTIFNTSTSGLTKQDLFNMSETQWAKVYSNTASAYFENWGIIDESYLSKIKVKVYLGPDNRSLSLVDQTSSNYTVTARDETEIVINFQYPVTEGYYVLIEATDYN